MARATLSSRERLFDWVVDWFMRCLLSLAVPCAMFSIALWVLAIAVFALPISIANGNLMLLFGLPGVFGGIWLGLLLTGQRHPQD